MVKRNLLLFYASVLCVLIKDILISLIKLFVPRKKLNIAGRTALVTGGGNGLGREISFLLAKEGCNVVICDIDLETAKKTSEEIKGKYNLFCEAFKVNVADVKQVEKLRDDIGKLKIGEVDILINNAGILAPIAVLEGTNSDIDRIIDVNLKSHFWTVRTFLPSMIERRQGSIIGICSVLGLSTVPFSACYSSSKFGVNGFYRSLLDDLCINNYEEFINVTCLYPGFINSSDAFEDYLNKIQIPFEQISVKSAAHYVLDAILKRTQFQIFPASYNAAKIIDCFPLNTQKFIKKEGSKYNNDAIRVKFFKSKN